MTLCQVTEAFLRRKRALGYLQTLGKNSEHMKPEDRDKYLATARVTYNKADDAYRKLAGRVK